MGQVSFMLVDDKLRFRFNSGHAVHEVFDEEVLVVNLDTGTYYSLLGTSAKIWHWLLGGASLAELLENLSAAYEGDAAQMATQTRDFIAQLVSDNLVVISGEAGVASGPPTRPDRKQPFMAPRLERFTDMQELLLLDPVHDVQDAGWPAAAPRSRPTSEP
jgi:hypothetical protein